MREARMFDVKVGATSNSPREWTEARLTRPGLRNLVEVTSCRGESSNSKPALDIYLIACPRLNVYPHQAAAVEDSRTGVEAAKDARLQCIPMSNDFTRG